MVHNFYKTFKDDTNNDNNTTNSQPLSGASRKFSKESMILKMFKIMREKSQIYLNNKKSPQEQEIAAAQTTEQASAIP